MLIAKGGKREIDGRHHCPLHRAKRGGGGRRPLEEMLGHGVFKAMTVSS